MIPGAQLIVGNTSDRVRKWAVELASFDTENVAGGGRVATQAIERAGIEPLLRAGAGAGVDDDVFGERVGDEIGVSVVGAPFVSDAVNCAVSVANEETGFESFDEIWIGVVNRQVEMFDEDCAIGEGPFTGRSEVDERVGRERHPAGFDCAIGPQRRIDGVRNEVGVGRKCCQIAESACLREERREGFAGGRRAGASEGVNMAAEAAHLAEINFVVLIEAEGGEAGVIRAGVWAGTGGHDAKEDFSGRAGGFIKDPDFLLDVIAKDVFAAEISGEETAMVDIAADDGLAFAVGVVE